MTLKSIKSVFNKPFLYYWTIYVVAKYLPFGNKDFTLTETILNIILTIIIVGFYIGSKIEKQNKQST